MKLGKFQKETAWAALSKGFTLVSFLLINMVLTRSMGREGFGAWSYFYAFFSVAYLASLLGINDSTRIHVARRLGGDVTGPIRDGLRFRLLISGVLAVLMFLSAPLVCAWIDRPGFVSLFRLGSVFLAAQGASDFFRSVFEGLHRLRYTCMATFTDYGLRLALLVVFVFWMPPGIAALFAFALGSLCASLFSWTMLRHLFSTPSAPQGTSSSGREGGRALLGYAMPMFVLAFGFSVSVELGTIMTGWLSTDAEVGIYAPAKEISARMMHGGLLLAMGTLQVFANMDPAEIPRLRKILRRLMFIAVVVYAGLCVFILLGAGIFMPLLFGGQFAEAATPMRLLTPFIFFYSISRVYSGILDYRGRAWRRCGYLVLSVGLNFALNLLLIPKMGANGAAIATSLAYIPYVVLTYVEACRTLWIPPEAYATAGQSRTGSCHEQ